LELTGFYSPPHIFGYESFYANLHGARSLKLGKPSIFAELTTTAMLLSFYPRKSGTFDVA